MPERIRQDRSRYRALKARKDQLDQDLYYKRELRMQLLEEIDEIEQELEGLLEELDIQAQVGDR